MPRKKSEGSAAKPRAAKAKSATTATAKPRARKKAAEAGSIGITASECASGSPPAAIGALGDRIRGVGGAVLGSYREPLGGHWVVLAALPIEAIAPTPYQRELSKTHADRLAGVIPKVGRFLDPVVAVAAPDGPGFITPNGMHRLAAMTTLGAKAITALVVPEPEVAFRILALNTEKAHNLRDKALEVVRMARALVAADDPRHETALALEFEQAAFLTIGLCYEANGRFSGGAYLPVVSRCDALRDEPLATTVPAREALAKQLLEVDVAVSAAVARLKESGFASGYLKPIVVARVNPIRFVKPGGERPDLAKTLAKMLAAAADFDPSKIKAADLAVAAAAAASGGSGDDE
ncbi:MAG: chromosome partitioning protein ParB [Deltaproteobacteria bacterium]|nr:chromosome partitioning protein ParB [Deltaproteobacteria bacterium]